LYRMKQFYHIIFYLPKIGLKSIPF